MINDIIDEINNILSVGSSKHSKMKSIILKGLSGGNLFVPKVFRSTANAIKQNKTRKLKERIRLE